MRLVGECSGADALVAHRVVGSAHLQEYTSEEGWSPGSCFEAWNLGSCFGVKIVVLEVDGNLILMRHSTLWVVRTQARLLSWLRSSVWCCTWTAGG